MKPGKMLIATLLAGVGIAALVAGCSERQIGAFVRGGGGVEGLMNTTKAALGGIDEPREIEMGRGMAETLLGARPLLDDAALQRYVNDVGAWVASRSERPQLPWRFGVNDSDHVNAFAAPGGFVIITRGMLNLLQNEAELAGVLGHEVGHVVRKHHLAALQKGAWMNLLASGASAAAADRGGEALVNALAGPTRELYARGLDRDDEFEADRVGVVLATRAGFDPYGLPMALQTLARIRPDDPYLSLLSRTHPSPGQRLERLGTVMGGSFDAFETLPRNASRYEAATRNLRNGAASR